ncbi:hypothetical protein ElyMa_006859400, partial [Elysia marginata]
MLIFVECPWLTQCQDSIQSSPLFNTTGDFIPGETTEAVLNDVCSKLPAMKSCIATKKDQCPSEKVKQEVEINENVFVYMCTPEGRQ